VRKPARRGEALSEEPNISVLTPDGVEIELPFQIFKQLKKLHLLERDRITGKRRIKKQAMEGAANGIASHISVRSPTGARFIGKNAGIRVRYRKRKTASPVKQQATMAREQKRSAVTRSTGLRDGIIRAHWRRQWYPKTEEHRPRLVHSFKRDLRISRWRWPGRRLSKGDVSSLARSIESLRLLHPIVVSTEPSLQEPGESPPTCCWAGTRFHIRFTNAPESRTG